ncbi:MAG TPA: phosphatase PAP2 family protein [Anaerolineaceae bacterium]|jgi:undecaprenyl-diphosphatase
MKPQDHPAPAPHIEQAAQQAARLETAARPVRRMRSTIFQIYLLAAIIGFSFLALLASTVAYFPVDLTITRAIQLLHFSGLEPLMVAVSWLGYLPQSIGVVLVICTTLYLFGFHWEALACVLVAGVDTLLNTLIKVVIHRPRPAADLVHVFSNVGNYSFPSGHVMFYTAFFGFLFFLVYTLLRRSIRRTVLLVVLGGLVALVGFSRIYLGEHWASDVIGAYIMGSLLLSAAVIVYRWGKPRFFANQPVAPEPPVKPNPS